jgi:hypothetical protein
LLNQADKALDKAVNDDDMTSDTADTLNNLLTQSASNLTQTHLIKAEASMTKACELFE